MDLQAQRVGTVRAFGTVSLVAGFMTALVTMASDYGRLEPHILAAFLVLTGLGLRVEAAIADRKS
ncbi:hypothetical protein AB0C06_03190 [Micromonospora inaquosa]|uniref:Uncharacterized protein n=1 Tax=Micromonospora inaquosa TaxID=2203716 RepID=A0A3N9WWQ4_9ACTN|nr:hypothetical protein [Micromonospora inaquosa]RQW99472.1 hypothetical protein DLJ59_24475 [Micromonospora inaquosa]